MASKIVWRRADDWDGGNYFDFLRLAILAHNKSSLINLKENITRVQCS